MLIDNIENSSSSETFLGILGRLKTVENKLIFVFNLRLFLPDPRVTTAVCCSSKIVAGPGCLVARTSFRRCCCGDDDAGDGDFRFRCHGHLYPSLFRLSWDYLPIRTCAGANGQTLWAWTWLCRECFHPRFSNPEPFRAFFVSVSAGNHVLLNFSVSFDILPIFFVVEQWIEQIFGSFSRKVVSFEFVAGDRRWRTTWGTRWRSRPCWLAPTWTKRISNSFINNFLPINKTCAQLTYKCAKGNKSRN